MEVGELGGGERADGRVGVLAETDDRERVEEGWRIGQAVHGGSVVGDGVHGSRGERREMEMEGGRKNKVARK